MTRDDIRAAIIAIAGPRIAVKGEKVPGCVLTLSQVMDLEELVSRVASEIARTPRSQGGAKDDAA